MRVIKINNSKGLQSFRRTRTSHIAFKISRGEACFANRRHRVHALSLLTIKSALKCIKLSYIQNDSEEIFDVSEKGNMLSVIVRNQYNSY